MLILEKFNDTWNYTFIIVASIAILVGTILTLIKLKKQKYINRIEKRGSRKKDTE